MSKKEIETDRYKSPSPGIDELLKEFSPEHEFVTNYNRPSRRKRSFISNSSSSVKHIRKKEKRSKNISNDRYTSSSPSLSDLLNPNKFKKERKSSSKLSKGRKSSSKLSKGGSRKKKNTRKRRRRRKTRKNRK